MDPKKLNDRAASYIGSLLILLGLSVNRYTIGFYSGGCIESLFYNSIIIALELVVITCGFFFIVKKPRGSLNISLTFTALLFTVILAEIVSVSIGLFIPPDFDERHNYFYGFLEPNSELGYKPRANLINHKVSMMQSSVFTKYNTDKYGFRNVGRDYYKSKIYFVGDSFTFGSWVKRDETFYGVIESIMDEPVISLGVGGYGFYQYYKIIKKILKDYHPDILALCVFANDLEPYRTESQIKNYYRYNKWNVYETITYPQTSLFYQFFKIAKKSFSAKLQQKELENGIVLSKHRGASVNYFSRFEYIEIEKVFLDIIKLAEEKNTEFIVFLFPSKESAYKTEYVRFFQTDYLSNEEKGYLRLCNIAEDKGVRCIDLASVFRRYSSEGNNLYFDKDPHWNVFGNKIAADTILPYITNGWKEE